MSYYTLVNAFATAVAVAVWVSLKSTRQRLRLLKLSALSAMLGFPWLYFGIQQEAWTHSAPGPRLFDVPINELMLAVIMSFINGGVLLLNYHAILQEASASTKPKGHSSKQE